MAGQYQTQRRHHSRHAGPVVEFVGGDSDDDDDIFVEEQSQAAPRMQTARKGTSGSKAKPKFRQGVTVPKDDHQTPGYPILKHYEEREYRRRVIEYPKKKNDCGLDNQRPPSTCTAACLGRNDDPQQHKNENPLLIPLICGWYRLIEPTRNRNRVVYMPPCEHRRLLQTKALQEFLITTDCRLTIDLFDFDTDFDPYEYYVASQPFVKIDDFTHGRENVRIECVNGFTEEKVSTGFFVGKMALKFELVKAQRVSKYIAV